MTTVFATVVLGFAIAIVPSAMPAVQAIQIARMEGTTADINDGFGKAVAMDGDVIVVGAASDGAEEAAFVYRYNGVSWLQEARLLSPLPPNARFGFDVAVSGNVIAVAAYAANTGTGSVEVYRFDGLAWNHEASLAPPASQPSSLFGYCVSLSGATLACGAPNASSPTSQGAAYVYSYNVITGWSQEAELPGPPFGNHLGFGFAIDVSGSDLVVGAFPGNSSSIGRAYVYKRVGLAAGCNVDRRGIDTTG
jgi:hypothetical protein